MLPCFFAYWVSLHVMLGNCGAASCSSKGSSKSTGALAHEVHHGRKVRVFNANLNVRLVRVCNCSSPCPTHACLCGQFVHSESMCALSVCTQESAPLWHCMLQHWRCSASRRPWASPLWPLRPTRSPTGAPLLSYAGFPNAGQE